MPVLSFGSSKFTTDVSSSNSLGTGSNNTSGPNGSAYATGNDENSDWSTYILGHLDFITAPGNLPADALITRIRCRARVHGNAQTSGGDLGSSNAGATCQIYGYILPGGAYNGGPDYEQVTVGGPPANVEIFDTDISFEINYSPAKTRTELIALFGTGGSYPAGPGKWLAIQMTCQAQGSALVTCAASTEISSWSFDVTFTTNEQYTWYIKPTVKIIDGKPLRIIESPDDIISIPSDETPPDGYIFYGTSADYPDGPEYLWWYSEEWYLYYFYTPLDPAIEDLPYVWLLVNGDGSAPTCTNCTQATIGELTVQIADVSGIYQLDPTATHDEVYTRTGFSVFVEADDVKIPNPFGKTGLVP